MGQDLYATLGIPYNAIPEEIRGAYFKLARAYHPDTAADPSQSEQFLKIQYAYEVLSDPKRRAKYDASLPAHLLAGPEISVSVKYSQPALAVSEEPQLIYALVDLICTADIRPESKYSRHFCLVLDQSTSMKGSRIEMVKSGALQLLQQLHPHDLISVVTFGDRAEVLVPPTRASNLSKTDQRIRMLQPGGGTELYQGLSAGYELLLQTESVHHRHLILLTDGHTYGDEDRSIELARQAADEGITISTLGIGNDWNDEFLDQIAGLSGGNCQYIASARDLNHFLLQKLTDLETIYARSLRLEFDHESAAQLRYGFRLSPSTGPLVVSDAVHLGDIQHRRTISFLLEFLVPALKYEQDHFSLARGQVKLEIPDIPSPNARIFLDLHRPVRARYEAEQPPLAIVEAMSKLTLYRMQEKIRQEVNQGKINEATRHLHYLATHLLSQGDRELAHTVLIEAEHIQQSRSFSDEGEKRIKYGTRALLLPPGPELIS